jgi:hypothetical protein
MPRRKLLGVATLACVLLAGCDLIAGQLRIVYDVIPPASSQQSTDMSVGVIGVDLTQNKDFKDNQDKIQSVDEAGFVFRARNNLGTAASGQVYMTSSPLMFPSADIVRQQGTLVLDGLSIAASGYVDVDLAQSIALQRNRALLHQQIQTGRIYLYGVAQGAPFSLTIDQLTVVLVLTVTN